MFTHHPDNMKTPAVRLLLGVCVLLLSALTVSAVSLHVSPNLQQFFTGSSSVSLTCVDDGQTVDGWTVKMTRGGHAEDCGAAGSDFGRLQGSSCDLDLETAFTAGCWCENSSGQRSDDVSISVSEKGVILEIPALPVITGSDVTLRCRQRDGDMAVAYFFFSGDLLGSGYKEHIITKVQQSDQGLYWCATDLTGESPRSLLRIRGPSTSSLNTSVSPPPPPLEATPCISLLPASPHPTNSSSPPPPPPPFSCMSVFRLLVHLLVFCPYFISTGLLLSICINRNSAPSSVLHPDVLTLTTGNRPAVSMEMTPCVEQNDDVAVDVTTEHDFSERPEGFHTDV